MNPSFHDTYGDPLVVSDNYIYADPDGDLCRIVKITNEYIRVDFKGSEFVDVDYFPEEFDDESFWLLRMTHAEVKETGQVKQDNPDVGRKYDQGKTQWWYLPIEPIKQVIDVLAYGDSKYPADDGMNWKRVPDARKRYYSALMRHVTAWFDGEKYDQESGKHHLAHAMTNCLFLLWFDIQADKQQKGN